MTEEQLIPMLEDKKKSEDEDIISSSIGDFGKWQLYCTFILSFFNVPCTWHIFAPTFHLADTETWCARPPQFRDVAPNLWKNCTGQSDDYCSMFDVRNVSESDLCLVQDGLERIKCSNWEYGGEGSTLISEFNLVCDSKNLKSLSEMVFLCGVAIGGLVCGIISDKYGRKRTLMASVLIQSTLGTIIAFSSSFLLYTILRTALGFISVSVVFSGFVLAIELVGGDWRTVAGISYLFPVSLGYMSIAGIAWFLRDWRHLQIAISLPGFLFLALWWILPESPRWLLALGKVKEVSKILEKAAKVNNKPLPHNIDKLQPQSAEEPNENVNVSDLFRTAQMRKKTFCLFLIWFSVYLVYYGLVLNLGNIGGNLYVNSVVQGAVEIPAIAISIFILLKGGRRWPLCLTMVISGVACLLAVPTFFFYTDLQWLVTTLSMISKFCISSSNAIMPVFTAELYPTTIRNIGVGTANVTAGIALILVPYLWNLSSVHNSVPLSVLAVFGIIGGLTVLFLPETGGVRLVDTIKEENATSRTTENDVSERKRINNNCCT